MDPPASGSLRLWRVFPFDPLAAEGEPYSVRSAAPAHRQTGGRFDLGPSPVLYLAETPAPAVGEVLRRFSGRVLSPLARARAVSIVWNARVAGSCEGIHSGSSSQG